MLCNRKRIGAFLLINVLWTNHSIPTLDIEVTLMRILESITYSLMSRLVVLPKRLTILGYVGMCVFSFNFQMGSNFRHKRRRIMTLGSEKAKSDYVRINYRNSKNMSCPFMRIYLVHLEVFSRRIPPQELSGEI